MAWYLQIFEEFNNHAFHSQLVILKNFIVITLFVYQVESKINITGYNVVFARDDGKFWPYQL